MRVSLGDDEVESSSDASAPSVDSALFLDTHAGDEPLDTSGDDASFEDVDAPDGDASLD